MNISREKSYVLNLRNKFKNLKKPNVSIIVPTNKRNYISNIAKNYMNLNYPNKELIIIINKDNIKAKECGELTDKYDNVRIFKLKENTTLGECLNFGVSVAQYDYIAKMDDDDYYGPNYLTDQMNAFNYTRAAIVGKAAYFICFEDDSSIYINNPTFVHRYVRGLAGGTLLIKKSVFKKCKFEHLNVAEDTSFLTKCYFDGIKIYATDPFNYLYIRHKDMGNNTWKVNKDILKQGYVFLTKRINYKEMIDVL
ncbi:MULTISPECIES: glycosyltransferase [Clostridium]|uniref:glycosyltransferase n=1 Tax=Clostridium TaxID=1485 RepID=UPI00082518EE|nr:MULTISPECIES: glycosyltransferase family 2 protein [Clostridium]